MGPKTLFQIIKAPILSRVLPAQRATIPRKPYSHRMPPPMVSKNEVIAPKPETPTTLKPRIHGGDRLQLGDEGLTRHVRRCFLGGDSKYLYVVVSVFSLR